MHPSIGDSSYGVKDILQFGNEASKSLVRLRCQGHDTRKQTNMLSAPIGVEGPPAKFKTAMSSQQSDLQH